MFSNVRSAILSHTTATFVSERSATTPGDCIKQRVCGAVIEGRRRSKKPSPWLVFLPFSEQTERKTRLVCPVVCPNGVPKTSSMPTMQSALVVTFSVEGDGLNRDRLHHFAFERFRVSVYVTYTCRCAVRWLRGRKRRFAKPLYGLKPVPRVRIPASPPVSASFS